MTKDFLGGLFLTLAGALMYACGYGFLDGYYDFFGVGLDELELDFQEIVAHGIQVLSLGQSLDTVAFVFLMSAFVFLCLDYLMKLNAHYHSPNYLLLLLSCLCLWLAASFAHSNSLGAARAQQDLASLDLIQIQANEAILDRLKIHDPELNDLYLLNSSHETTHVVIKTEHQGVFMLVRIPTDQIGASVILRNRRFP